MARYTVELRDVVENHEIFDFEYDFYDDSKRKKFEENFIRHFYFREIGQDTVDKFKLFLEDKMHTVFPYYNELFKTAAIEYSVLDNYDIRETTTMTRENTGSTSGESYTVGKTIDEQTAKSEEERTGNSNVTTSESSNGTSDTTRNGSETFEGEANQTVTEDKTKTANETENADYEDKKRFLDTPQGAVDLSDSRYLTTLNHDTSDRDTTKNLSATEDNEQTTKKTESTERTSTDSSNTTDEHEKSGSENVTENGNTTTESTFSGEHRTTNDGAIRSRSEGTTSETIEHTRKGNIGVDTDADMIQKHIKLQKILTQIQRMFFDECEDLFMLVW